MWKSLAVVTAIIGLMGLALRIATNSHPEFTNGRMPPCESKTVANLLKQAFENSPAAKIGGMTVYDVGDVRAVAGQWSDAKQHCQATVFTNTGRRETSFTTELIGADKDKIWLETSVF